MSRKNWIDRQSQCVLPAAFFRRPPPKDEVGLSVDLQSACSCAGTQRDCYGVVSLHVGRVRDLGLDVVPDSPPHGNITGLPRQADDRARAEHLASQLAKHARIVSPEQYRDLA
jgi:hypothetical protein